MLLSLVFATAALACLDPGNKIIPHAYDSLRSYESENSSFGACLDKLAQEGVDLHTVQAWRKERSPGSVSPVIYTITVQGNDRDSRPLTLKIEYDLDLHAFSCGKPTHRINRCF